MISGNAIKQFSGTVFFRSSASRHFVGLSMEIASAGTPIVDFQSEAAVHVCLEARYVHH
jgi:hypothetical protein